MKKENTIKNHIRELRKFIDAPTSAEHSSEVILSKRLAYLVETILRYEVEHTVDWGKPLDQVLFEVKHLLSELNIK